MTKERKEAEVLVCRVMDALDKTGKNSAYWKEKFSAMSDSNFLDLLNKKFPFMFQQIPFEIEPKMEDCNEAANIIGVPLLEKVSLPYLYINGKGEPVQSKECLVGYMHIKRPKQMLIKKNSMSTNISARDMKTGLLIFEDKNGKTSDREVEALSILGLEKTIDELVGARADAMDAKSKWYNTISNTGQIYQKDIPKDVSDSLSKNLINTYFLGACIYNNMINEDYMLPYTIESKKKKVERE